MDLCLMADEYITLSYKWLKKSMVLNLTVENYGIPVLPFSERNISLL